MAATKGQEENPNDRAAKHVNAVQPSERRNDRGVFNSLCSSMGAVGVYCAGNRPQEAGRAEPACPCGLLAAFEKAQPVPGSLMGMSNRI